MAKARRLRSLTRFGLLTIAHDVTVFDRRFGLPPLSLRVIQPAGAVPRYRPTMARTGAAGETTLDVEWAHNGTRAKSLRSRDRPRRMRDEAASRRSSRLKVCHQASSRRRDQPELRGDRADLPVQRCDPGAAWGVPVAAKPGYRVTVVASTGDSGAAGQTYSTRSYFTTPEVSWPASDPLVTAVGGTQLAPAGGATPRRPGLAWPDSGGGRSAVFTRPAYQSRVAGVVGEHRGIPDISMDASCASAAAVYGRYGSYPAGSPGWSTACGTSLAAPMFAGIAAGAAQQAGHTLGAINPALYRMAAGHAPGIVDVVHGEEQLHSQAQGKTHIVLGFHAQRGYDLISGLGKTMLRYPSPNSPKPLVEPLSKP